MAKSVRSAVNAAAEIPVRGKRVGVLGDIAETGSYAQATHEEIIKIVNESNFDILIAYGTNICEAAARMKIREGLTLIPCQTRAELNKTVKRTVKRGDLVLFKASHSSGLEKTLKATFPFTYRRKSWEYSFPLIKWRFLMLFN